jgi:hypothetical protein
MTTSNSPCPGFEGGRDRSQRFPSPGGPPVRLVVVSVSLLGLLVAAMSWALSPVDGDADAIPRASVNDGWQARSGGQQVLGGDLRAGEPSVQRLVHDNVSFTVSVGPGAPGRNLVRVDTGHAHGGPVTPVLVGTTEQDLVRARPRPGADGLWANVNLPKGEGVVLVTHGPAHRIPFVVPTGTDRDASSAWGSADGAECLAAATGRLTAGGRPTATGCPADRLTGDDRDAVASTVDLLFERGVRQLALHSDSSARSRAATKVATATAVRHGIDVVAPGARPDTRSALLDLSGWLEAAEHLAAETRKPQREQLIRADGVWLAPWLLSRGVVDSTAGAILPLTFDIRDAEPQRYAQVLAKYLPGQAPTAAGFAAWLAEQGGRPGTARLYAASRAAYMPASAGHSSHETQVSWFPGGTITPVGPPVRSSGNTSPSGH